MLDLNAVGAKVIDGSGGGTSLADPARQTVQISQTNLGAIPVIESGLEATAGTTADAGWIGTGVASLVGLLKSIALRLGVGAAVQDGSGSISIGGQSQVLFSGLTPVNGYLVQNTAASGNLTINDTAAAGTASSIQLIPNQMWVTPQGYKPPGPVNVAGPLSGMSFVARMW